jgi:hypothetical protein
MDRVLSTREFFNQLDDSRLSQIRESLIAIPSKSWNNIHTLRFPDFKDSTEQEITSSETHQLFLLENFNDLNQISVNENLLINAGYDPIVLSMNGTYLSIVEQAQILNESLASTLKSFWLTMTEEGSPIGILQFMIDIAAFVGTFIGFPGLANVGQLFSLANALIYFFRTPPRYGMGFLNLLGVIPFGSAAVGPIKAGIKPVMGLFERFMPAVFKGNSAAIKSGAASLNNAAKNPGLIKMLGEAFANIGKFIAESGIKLIKSIVSVLSTIINKVTFGVVSMPAGVTKWVDQLAVKMALFGKGSIEAAEALGLKATKTAAKQSAEVAATKVGAEAAATAKAVTGSTNQAAKAAGTVAKDKVLADLGKFGTFRKGIFDGVKASPEYISFASKTSNPTLLKEFIYKKASTNLVELIASKKVGLMSVYGDAALMKALGKNGKIAERALVDAINSGDKVVLRKLISETIKDPKLFSAIAAREPKIANTLLLFKEAPEALIHGATTFNAFASMSSKFAGKFVYRGFVMKYFLLFLGKMFIKGDPCANYLMIGTPSEVIEKNKDAILDKVAKHSVNIGALTEILSDVIIEQNEETVDPIAIQKEVDKLKATDPTNYAKFEKVVQENDKAVQTLKSEVTTNNPCHDAAKLNQANVGLAIDHNLKAWKEGKVVTDMTSKEDHDAANILNYTKDKLAQIGVASDIDPQSSIASENPEVKAYFSDIVDYAGKLEPNFEDASRLDSTLERMVKAGTITQEQSTAMKQRTVKHWQDNTVPPILISNGADKEQANESIFRIGKLTTIR